VLVTTLTKRMAEDLTSYLTTDASVVESGLKVQYLHADVNTLDRQDILDDLREGKFDVVVGINLLREGLDLPEVSLVVILDADKEGFLRSDTSLVQTMGRAARHVDGKVIMYADSITGSMRRAIDEVDRRREIQVEYNTAHEISPKTITKPIREKLVERKDHEITKSRNHGRDIIFDGKPIYEVDQEQLTPEDRKKLVRKLEKEMRKAARELDFERAAELRDRVSVISIRGFVIAFSCFIW
jgi:excinuclease ABC subunit B